MSRHLRHYKLVLLDITSAFTLTVACISVVLIETIGLLRILQLFSGG